MIYALGDKGANLLQEHYGIERGKIDWRNKNSEVKERHLKHTVMVANFRVALTLVLKEHPTTRLLGWEQDPKVLKDEFKMKDKEGRERRLIVCSDAFFGLEDREGRFYFFLEADLSTMTTRRFLEKMRAYWYWWESEGHARKHNIKRFRVLTLTKSKERRESLRRITTKADRKEKGSEMFWFATEKDFDFRNPQSILESIWFTPVDGKGHIILE